MVGQSHCDSQGKGSEYIDSVQISKRMYRSKYEPDIDVYIVGVLSVSYSGDSLLPSRSRQGSLEGIEQPR